MLLIINRNFGEYTYLFEIILIFYQKFNNEVKKIIKLAISRMEVSPLIILN